MAEIGFIGAGNMASAMIGGIVSAGLFPGEALIASNPSEGKLLSLREKYQIAVTRDNREAAREAKKVLFLCVKPIFLKEVIEEIRTEVGKDTVVVSIAAGKKIEEMEAAFARTVKLVRVMPNTPALVGEGISAVCPNAEMAKKAHREELEQVLAICRSFGEAVELPERLIDVAGQVGGASPAWIFMVIEALADGAVAEGMPRDMAYRFAAAGVAGAGKLAQKKGLHPGQLKDMVTSPGGTTIEGVRVLEEHGVRGAFMDAVISSCEKAKRM